MSQNPPERRCVLEIKIGADDPERLITLLEDILFNFRTGGGPRSMVSGGPDGNYAVSYREDQTMTHDIYFEQIDAWLKEHRAGVEKP